MSKYKSRLNKLVIKTHTFVSHHNLRIIRDCFKANFNEFEKPEDFDTQYIEYKKLADKHLTSNDAITKTKMNEMSELTPALHYKYRYEVFSDLCKSDPFDKWLPTNSIGYYSELVKDAKRYFKEKKSQG